MADAEPVYRHALQLSPAIGDTHLQLGHALKLQGRTSEAAEAYASALRLGAKEYRGPRGFPEVSELGRTHASRGIK